MPSCQPCLTCLKPASRKEEQERHGPALAFICRLKWHGQAFFPVSNFEFQFRKNGKKTTFPLPERRETERSRKDDA